MPVQEARTSARPGSMPPLRDPDGWAIMPLRDRFLGQVILLQPTSDRPLIIPIMGARPLDNPQIVGRRRTGEAYEHPVELVENQCV